MKTSAFIAILMAGVTVLSAANVFPSEITRCRELDKAPLEVSAHVLISQDLTSGTWTTSTNESYDFGENGTLAIFKGNGHEEMSADVANWKVDMLHGEPILMISTQVGGFLSYKVEQTCEGVLLTDNSSNDILSLEYSAPAVPGRNSNVKTHIRGEWTNVTFFESGKKCSHANGAFLNYTFEEDGSYECNYGSRKANKMETGTWMISKDGQFLLLTSNMGSTSVVRINHVDSHGLMLEQVMMTNEIGDFFCSEQTSFAFIK